MSSSYKAMRAAMLWHADQKRKYTNEPYIVHLAEVAGLVSSVAMDQRWVNPEVMLSVAWLHDCIEDQNIKEALLMREFGGYVTAGVLTLSDIEVGRRSERKAAARQRQAAAPAWVQTIKYADLISNTKSIVQHDPKFAPLYLSEASLLLDAIFRGHWGLYDLARKAVDEGLKSIGEKNEGVL